MRFACKTFDFLCFVLLVKSLTFELRLAGKTFDYCVSCQMVSIHTVENSPLDAFFMVAIPCYMCSIRHLLWVGHYLHKNIKSWNIMQNNFEYIRYGSKNTVFRIFITYLIDYSNSIDFIWVNSGILIWTYFQIKKTMKIPTLVVFILLIHFK